MGLYTSLKFNNRTDKQETKIQHTLDNSNEQKNEKQEEKKSYYSSVKSKQEYEKKLNGKNFLKDYKVGQYIKVIDKKNELITNRGRITRISAEDLMFIEMEDTYKDVREHFLGYMVTGEDKIIPLS